MKTPPKNESNVDKMAEAILFAHGEPMASARLAKAMGLKIAQVETALNTLQERLVKTSGLRLIQKDRMVQLVSAKEYAAHIEKLYKAQRKEELSRAALEVLAIIAYSGPVTRAQIEDIRGVNSAYIIRTLLMRGLAEESRNGNTTEYTLSFECMRKLGLSSPHDLPEWPAVVQEIERAQNSTSKNA